MARPSDLAGEVQAALETSDHVPAPASRVGADAASLRRVRAMALRLAGFTDEKIGEDLNISANAVRDMLKRTLTRAEKRNVDEMRDLENARLDRAQAGIWSRVLAGEDKAITTFLAISRQRVALNGLNAPTRIEISSGIRDEMQTALGELEALVAEHGRQRPQEPIVVHEHRQIEENRDTADDDGY